MYWKPISSRFSKQELFAFVMEYFKDRSFFTFPTLTNVFFEFHTLKEHECNKFRRSISMRFSNIIRGNYRIEPFNCRTFEIIGKKNDNSKKHLKFKLRRL